MHRLPPLLLVLLLSGCATDPSAAGFADVVGQVFLDSGAPLAAATVSVSCGGRALALAQSDSLGNYQVGLQSSAGQHRCAFAVTGAGAVSFSLDTVVGFSPAGLHPLQWIDLRQRATL